MKNVLILRLALLDDVYRQIRANNSTMESGGEIPHEPPFRRIDTASINNDNEEEVGIASGYAIQHPAPSGFVRPQNHANDIDYDNYNKFAVAGNKAGLCFIFSLGNFSMEKVFVHATKIKYTSIYTFPHTLASFHLNNLFEPNPNPPYPIHQPELISDPTFEFRPSFYPNFYTIPEPHLYPSVIIHEHNETANDTGNKWWPWHSLKEKIKSFFKIHKEKIHNSLHRNLHNNQHLNLHNNQHHLQGKI